jgi:hypothetical protein
MPDLPAMIAHTATPTSLQIGWIVAGPTGKIGVAVDGRLVAVSLWVAAYKPRAADRVAVLTAGSYRAVLGPTHNQPFTTLPTNHTNPPTIPTTGPGPWYQIPS